MKNKIKQLLIIIFILTIVFILENLNTRKFPVYISRYSVSNIIYEFFEENGHLPIEKLRHDDMYQPVIFLSYLLLFFLRMTNSFFNDFSFIIFYAFPIIVYLLTYELSNFFKINKSKTRMYIALINAIIASSSLFILDMSNDLLIFLIILFLIYIHINDNFQFTKRFYIIAFTSSIIITFFYYTGQLIYTIFIFLFYLYYLIINTKPKKSSSIFLLLSCLNFLLVFSVYGILGNVGFSASLQNNIYNLFSIPPIWFFSYLSIIIILFHILLEKKFKYFSKKIFKFVEKTIKLWILVISGIILFSIIFIIINLDILLTSESLLLHQFTFPPPYFDPLTRSFNVIIFFILIIPYLLFGISILKKINQKIRLSQIDLLYLISISLLLIFVLIYYFYGGLNIVVIRGIRIAIIFAVLFIGFFLIDPKSFLTLIRDPTMIDIKTTTTISEKLNSREEIPKFYNINLKKKKLIKKIDEFILLLLTQGLLQIILIMLLDQDYIMIYYLKFVIITINYSFLPGYFFIKVFSLKTSNIIEQFIMAIFISFCLLILSLTVLNFLSIFTLYNLIMIPYILFVLNIFMYLIFKNTRKLNRSIY